MKQIRQPEKSWKFFKKQNFLRPNLYATAFNQWRKKYWLTRVIILLLIFSVPIYERLSGNFLIVDLVKIAIQAILNSSEPTLATAKTHHYRICEAQHLRASIKTYLDKDENGTIDENEYALLKENGFDTKEINKKAVYSNAGIENMRKLSAIAKHFRLLPAGYNIKQIWKESFYAGLAETELENKPLKKEIDDDLAYKTWPDYTKWTVWKSGIEEFGNNISGILFIWGPLHTTIAWLMICFYISVLLSQILPTKFKRILAALIPVLITLLIIAYNKHSFSVLYGMEPPIYIMIAFSSLAAAVSLKGVKYYLDGNSKKMCIHSFLRSICIIIFIWGSLGIFLEIIKNYPWWKTGYIFSMPISWLISKGLGSLILDTEKMKIWQYMLINFLSITVFAFNFILPNLKNKAK